MMKMTRNSRMQSLISLIALSLGLCFVSPASAGLVLLDSSGKVLSEIGTLGGYGSNATGINDSGQVVGWSPTATGSRAFITGPNGMGMTDLGSLGGDTSEAYGVNNAGQVVGKSYNHAFITGRNKSLCSN